MKVVKFDMNLLGDRRGSAACKFVADWAKDQGLSGETRVEYGDTGEWNVVKSMVFNDGNNTWNGGFRTRLPAAIGMVFGKSTARAERPAGSTEKTSTPRKSTAARKGAQVTLDAETGLVNIHIEHGIATYHAETGMIMADRDAMKYYSNLLTRLAEDPRAFVQAATELDANGNPYEQGFEFEGYTSKASDAKTAVNDMLTQAAAKQDTAWVLKNAGPIMLGKVEPKVRSSGVKAEFMAKWLPAPVVAVVEAPAEPVVEAPAPETIEVVGSLVADEPKKPARRAAKVQ